MADSGGKLISVIVPTCDRGAALRTCLQALSADVQSLDAGLYELIVTDDGKIPVAAEDLAGIQPTPQCTRGPQRGPAANRNHGAAQAQGRYLAFIDDDCIASPAWLSKLAQAISEGDLVMEGRTTTDYPLNGPFAHAPINESGGYLWSCNFAIERDLFSRLGGFDERFPYPFLEDVDFRTRLLASGHNFKFVPEATVLHPQRMLGAPQKYARQFESYYLYSNKHNCSLSASGFSVGAYGRVWAKMLLKSRSPLEAMRVLGYLWSLCTTLAWLMPGWQRKYRLLRSSTAERRQYQDNR